MEKLTMCRVCLGEDIRRVSIVGTHLQEMYESLVLMPFETEDNRPILVCYICRTRLKNCYELKKKCLQSEEMFKQMLSCNKYGQVKLQAINNKTSGVGHILGMDADNVGVEFLKCKVKEEPKEDEDVSEDVLEENSISDDMLLSAYSDSRNKKNTFNVLEMDAHSVGVEALKCKVKEEPNDDQDVGEDVLEENSVSDDMLLSAYSSRNESNMFHVLEMNSDNDGLAALKCEVEYEPNDDEDVSTPEDSSQSVQRSSEDVTSSNLNKHGHVQDMWKKDISRINITNAHTHTAQIPHQFNTSMCNKHFSRTYHLTCQSFTHTTDISKKQCSKKDNLKTHKRENTGKKIYLCDVCKKQFTHKSHFTAHVRIHTGEKLYHCDICKKEFSHKNNFTTHMRIHTGEKPYQCDICQKKFSQKSHFTTHMRTHTGEKPYQCDICKNQFIQRSHYTTHMRTHTGEKPYHCDICKKHFSKNENLTRHMRTHTSEKS